MKRAAILLAAVVLVGAAVAWSGPKAARPEFDFVTEKLNPVTNLKLNNDPAEFQFVVVSDRTGGHRAKVFARAVEQINLLQPEFVMSVGDLIEGYTENKEQIAREWREFQNYTARLQMPFFYAPGNHDITNKVMDATWKEKFGRSYYEFLYRDVLMIVLNSEDPPGVGTSRISEKQQEWLKKVLDDNVKARWTMVFLHKPMWIESDLEKNGWLAVEKLLAGRKHTVFAGHVHRYQKFARNGSTYYMLSTTGGASRLRGVEYGEFDHITWVTMKKSGPVIANILLDGVVREDLSAIPSEEEGVKDYFRRPTALVTATVTRKGQPIAGASVVFLPAKATKTDRMPTADGLTSEDGKAKLSTYGAFDGAVPGEYIVTVAQRTPRVLPDGKPGPNQLPAQYADPKTTPLRFTVKPRIDNVMTIDLDN